MEAKRALLTLLLVAVYPKVAVAQQEARRERMDMNAVYVKSSIGTSIRDQSSELLIFRDNENRDVMTMNLRTGEMTFKVPVSAAAKEFAKFVAEYYSGYCEALRREIRELKNESPKRAQQ